MVEPISAAASEIVKTVVVSTTKESLAESLKEVVETTVKESPVKSMMETIENTSLETLNAQKEATLNQIKLSINEKSPFSEEINKHIRNIKELDIYNKANLKEENINGKPCLIRIDIDPNIQYDFGIDKMTNMERMKNGLAPLDIENKPIELHHIGQEQDSPLAELRQSEHRNNSIDLHKNDESKIDRSNFYVERANHWIKRAKMFGGINA
jgi:hypothetical protein